MAERKYYWIKLKTDFFEQETIDFLMSQKNGCSYIVLYQMLCLKTANNGGQLSSSIGEMIVPYDIEKIVRDTKYFDFDTVTVALELFKQLGLIYFSAENNALQIADYDKMVGSETAAAERMRKSRAKKLQDDTEKRNNVTKMLHKSIDIDNRDKSIDKDKKYKIYGEFENVKLTADEYEKVKSLGLLPLIEDLSCYIAQKGDKYKSHYATIRAWGRKREAEKPKQNIASTYDIDKIAQDTMFNDDYEV